MFTPPAARRGREAVTRRPKPEGGARRAGSGVRGVDSDHDGAVAVFDAAALREGVHEAHLAALEVTAVEGLVRRAGRGHQHVVRHDRIEHGVCDGHVVPVQDVDLRRGAADDGDSSAEHLVDVDRGLGGDLDATVSCVALDQRDNLLLRGDRRRRLGDIIDLDGWSGQAGHTSVPFVVPILSDENQLRIFYIIIMRDLQLFPGTYPLTPATKID
jgi:hypothetical protein